MGYMHDEETTGKTIDKGTNYRIENSVLLITDHQDH